MYVGDRKSNVFRPVRELKGFEKVFLAPGETRTVAFTLDKRAFAYWNEQIHDWYVESGVFDVEIGVSSRDIVLRCAVTVEGTVALPARFTVDSIFSDLMKNPKAVSVLRPILDAMTKQMQSMAGSSEGARSAISAEMVQAMLNNLPLRGVVSFAGGRVTYEQLQTLIDQING